MDLIEKIIKVKTETKKYELTDILKELIFYEKISRIKKFQHMHESPYLQEHMPICWNAFNYDTEALMLLHESEFIVNSLRDEPLIIYNDLKNAYKSNEQTRLVILGGMRHPHYKYCSLKPLINMHNSQTILDKATILTENFINNMLKVVIITNDTIYTGTIPKHNDINNESTNHNTQIEYEYQEENNVVKIKSFSNQGNNDYQFGKVNQFKVSMPNQKTIRYQIDDTHFDATISENDQRKLYLNKSNLTIISKLLIKYLPTGCEF